MVSRVAVRKTTGGFTFGRLIGKKGKREFQPSPRGKVFKTKSGAKRAGKKSTR